MPDLTDLLDAGEFPYGSANKSQDRGELTPNSFRRGAQTPVGGNPSSNAAEKDKGAHSRHRSQISVMVDLPERTPKSQDWSKPIVSISKSDPNGPPFAQTDVQIVDIHHYASGKSTPRHLNASDHKKEDVSIVKSAAEGVLPKLSMSENQNKSQQMLEVSEIMNPRISFGGDQETHQSPKSICRGMADQPTETSQEKQVHSSSNRDNPFKMSRLNLQGTDKSVVTVKKTPRWYVPGNSDSEGHPNSMGTSGRQTKNFEEDRVDSPEEHKSSKQKNSKKSVKTASFDVAYPEGEHAKKGHHSKPKGHAERDSIESKQSFKRTKEKDQPARDETTSDHSKANSQDCMGGITQKCILI